MKKFKLSLIALFLLFNSEIASSLEYSNETEVGQTTTGGNAESTSVNLIQKSTFVTDSNTYIINGQYQYAEASDVVVVRNWLVNTRLDHVIQNKLEGYTGVTISGNKFSGFYERFDVDGGLKHYLTKPKDDTDRNKFYVEAGLRYSKENRIKHTPDFNDEIIQGRLFMLFQHEINDNLYYSFDLDNIGNLESPGRYRGIFNAAIHSIMTKFLTLKVSYQTRYDDYLSKEGLERRDYTYTTSVIANF